MYDSLSNNAVTGTKIRIVDIDRIAFTDSAGVFHFNDITPALYLLEITTPGYKTIVSRISIKNDTILSFLLQPSITELGEMVVTAVSRVSKVQESPVVISILNKNLLEQNTSSNIIGALSSVAGVSNISTGAGISKPVIRGLGFNRVIVLDNGVKQEGQQWGDEHGVEIDEFAIERVEIIKGPGSLIYGSDGIAGVLNFLAPKPMSENAIQTRLVSNYQSNNHLIANSISTAGNRNSFSYLFRFSQKIASNYQNAYDGKVYNSGFREFDGNIFLGFTRKWGHTYLRINSWNNALNLPEGERDSLGYFTFENTEGEEITATAKDLSGYKIGYPNQQVNHISIISNNLFLLKKGITLFDIGFQNNKRREYESINDKGNPNLFFDLYTLSYNLRYNLPVIKSWENTVGASGMFQSNNNKGNEFLIPDYILTDVGIFLTTQKKFKERFSFSAGIRGDIRNVITQALFLDENENPVNEHAPDAIEKFAALNKLYFGFSGSAGIAYFPNRQNTIKINFSSGFRAPNIAEISSNGRHEGTFRYETGNPNLQAENNFQFDIAYTLHSDHISIELSPFVNYVSNYIFLDKSEKTSVKDEMLIFKFQQGHALLFGGEIFSDLHPHPFDWLHIENTFSFVRAMQLNQADSAKNLPLIPAPRYRVEIKAALNKLGKYIGNSYIKLGATSTFAQKYFYAVNNTETHTPAYTLLNLGIEINFNLKQKKDFLSLIFNIENITDKSYQSHLSKLKYAPKNIASGRVGIFDMGRNFSIKAIWII